MPEQHSDETGQGLVRSVQRINAARDRAAEGDGGGTGRSDGND